MMLAKMPYYYIWCGPRNTRHIWHIKCGRTWGNNIQNITRSTRPTLLHQKEYSVWKINMLCSQTAWERIVRAIHYSITTTSKILWIWKWNRKQHQRSNNIMFIIKIKETATHRTRCHTNQACTNRSSHGMEDASHYTKQIEEKNQIPSQVAESLNKLNLHKPQQDRQKLQHKQQQAHHYPPQKGCPRCGAKGHQADYYYYY